MNTPTQQHSSAILITAGGTGGHVIPAHVLSQALQSTGQYAHFVTDFRGRSFITDGVTDNITVIPLPRYQGGLLQKFKFIWALIPSIYQCWRLIRRHRITIVIGFGGYIAVPALIAGMIANCKIILHEQNTVLGRVNRWFGRFAHKIALSTPHLEKCPQYLQQKCVTIGLPIRPEIDKQRHMLIPTHFKAESNRQLHILIIGGSQAAGYFSQLIPQALTLMPESLRDRLYIHQQCRSEDIVDLQQVYQRLNINVELKTYFNDMPTKLFQADLIVARAGASSIAEISAVGRAAFFILYPHAMDDHQTSNAEMATHYGGGWWQPQSRCDPKTLNQFFQYVIKNPQVLIITGEAARHYAYAQATTKLIYLIQND